MTDAPNFSAHWQIGRERFLSLDVPRLMGIVNATPDSFSDGGRFPSVDALIGRGLRLVEEGADLIDVGGESTRPGAERVAESEQIDRVVPLVEALVEHAAVPISVDTTRAAVAVAALDAGATIVNDVSAGREDDAMFACVGARGAGLVLMHRRVPPGDDRYSDAYETPPVYDDVVADVGAFLLERVGAARASGVAGAALVIDPGLGFGKSVEQNYALIARTAELTALGHPVLGAASRKSFVGAATRADDPARRVIGSTAVSVIQYLGGVRLFRVHDVAAHAEALAVAAAAVPGGMPAAVPPA